MIAWSCGAFAVIREEMYSLSFFFPSTFPASYHPVPIAKPIFLKYYYFMSAVKAKLVEQIVKQKVE